MFEWLFPKKVKYAVFIEVLDEKILSLNQEFNENLSELEIARKIKAQKFIKTSHSLYNTDNIVSITLRKTEP